MKSISSILVIVLLPAGCSLFGYGDSGSRSAITLGETFTLQEGESALLAPSGATVTFVEKVADSRCPLGVDCFWEGEARILLAFAPSGQDPTSFELKGYVGPDGGGAATADVLGHRFTLERLDPYPVEGQPGQDPATATLKVETL